MVCKQLFIVHDAQYIFPEQYYSFPIGIEVTYSELFHEKYNKGNML